MGVCTLEMAGEKKIGWNSYCPQRNSRVGSRILRLREGDSFLTSCTTTPTALLRAVTTAVVTSLLLCPSLRYLLLIVSLHYCHLIHFALCLLLSILFVCSSVVCCSFIVYCSFTTHSSFVVCLLLLSCHSVLPLLLLWSLICCYHILDFFLIVVLLLSSLSSLALVLLIAVPHHLRPSPLSSSRLLIFI